MTWLSEYVVNDIARIPWRNAGDRVFGRLPIGQAAAVEYSREVST